MGTTNGSAGQGFYIGLAIGQIWLSLISKVHYVLHPPSPENWSESG